MKIPNKIRIGGQDINIINKDRIENDYLGDICVAEGTLRIADNFGTSKQSDSSKFNTFIHEVVHMVLDSMGETELSQNEKFVNTFAGFTTEIIRSILREHEQDIQASSDL